MNETNEPKCPECRDPMATTPTLDRRSFIRVVGGVAAVAVTGGSLAAVRAARLEKAKAAEALIQELHANLSDEQKKSVLLAYDHGAKGALPTRLGMYNSAVNNVKIGGVYT